jgi:hypothetical protein|tara:strand:+ start:3542 stop:3982 length:441 start_codon:yes stop_codon:yes gene_type:complete
MVQINRFEKFIQRAVWRLTRSSDLIKYIPKSLHNGVLVGDCAVIRNKMHTFDVYSKQRKPLQKDICNYKVAICIATVLNQYTAAFQTKLKSLKTLDNSYAIAVGKYHNIKAKIEQNPHLEDSLSELEQEVLQLSDKIDEYYIAMTL